MTDYTEISQGTLPAAGTWKICAGDGVFFAARSASTSAAISTDGISWNSITLPFNPFSISFANDRFFITSSTTTDIAYSTDKGQSWITGGLPSIGSWYNVAWNGTVYCVTDGSTGGTTKASTSVDGLAWIARTLPSSRTWRNIAWNGSVFCALDTSSTGKYARSTDGISWAEGATGLGNNSSGLIAHNGEFIATVNNTGLGGIWTSSDAINWVRYGADITVNGGNPSVINNDVFIPPGTGTTGKIFDTVSRDFYDITLTDVPTGNKYSASQNDIFCVINIATSSTSYTFKRPISFWTQLIGTRQEPIN